MTEVSGLCPKQETFRFYCYFPGKIIKVYQQTKKGGSKVCCFRWPGCLALLFAFDIRKISH